MYSVCFAAAGTHLCFAVADTHRGRAAAAAFTHLVNESVVQHNPFVLEEACVQASSRSRG